MILKINYYYNINGDIVVKKVSKVEKVKQKFSEISWWPYIKIYSRYYYHTNMKGCRQLVWLFNTEVNNNRFINNSQYMFLFNLLKPYIRDLNMLNILK